MDGAADPGRPGAHVAVVPGGPTSADYTELDQHARDAEFRITATDLCDRARMDALAVDAIGQRLVEFRRDPEPSERELAGLPCPLALAVVRNQDRVLLGLNRWRQEWELPGGLIESSESARAAASRELFEETGVVVRPDRLTWSGFAVFDLVNPERRELAAVYTVALQDPLPLVNSDELVQVDWCLLDEPPKNHSPLDLVIALTAAKHAAGGAVRSRTKR